MLSVFGPIITRPPPFRSNDVIFMGLIIDNYCENRQQFTNIINILDDKPEEKYNLQECVTETGTYLKAEASSEVTGFIDGANEWAAKKYNDLRRNK